MFGGLIRGLIRGLIDGRGLIPALIEDSVVCIVAVFAIPGHQRLSKKPSHKPLPLTVICDNIRDPGNMAKIIQSSVAVRCDRVLVTKGCFIIP